MVVSALKASSGEDDLKPILCRMSGILSCSCIAAVPRGTWRGRRWRQARCGRAEGGSDKCDGIGVDSLITAAGRALAAGDPLGALNRVALRDDPPALALRGIAMAQLGDLVRARALLRAAARGFGPREAVARARCVVAEAEIAFVSRDLGWPAKALDVGAGDAGWRTATGQTRRMPACSRRGASSSSAGSTQPRRRSPGSHGRSCRRRRGPATTLVAAGIAMRRLTAKPARAALARAERAARRRGDRRAGRARSKRRRA